MANFAHKPSKGIAFKETKDASLNKNKNKQTKEKQTNKKKAIVDMWKLGLSVFVIPIIGQNGVHTLLLFKALLKVSITRLFK